ncbi:TetR/AcrR family transcriptional regulator [Stenotrophobium rhamnosiphilum]|nr:TetR/AcrR family transcriptional regulator [Stenotrophobium rhamnosiphilum]
MDSRRSQIIDGLLASISKKGLANTSTQDVAAACGLSVGSMYVHFKSKEEILHAAVRRSNAQLESGEFYKQFGDPKNFLKVMDGIFRYDDQLANDPTHGVVLEVMLMARHDPVLRREIEINQKARFDFIRECAALIPGAKSLRKSELDALVAAFTALLADADQRALAGIDVQRTLKMAAVRQLIKAFLPAQVSTKAA